MAASKTDPGAQKVLELLKKVRESKTVSLAPSKFLRKEVQALDGSTVPFNLRYYQVQGVFHFLSVNRMVLGDSTGLGKCVAKSTKLLTKTGLVTIESLAPVNFDWSSPEGFYPMGRLEEVWTGTKWAPLKNFYWSGRKPSIRITTSRGYQLEGSYVHPILTYSQTVARRGSIGKFSQLSELVVGSIVLCSPGPLPQASTDACLTDPCMFLEEVVKIEHFEAELMDVEVDDPEHTFWSNGFISHNTCQAIAAMCYIWEKDPTYKVMVICPKSAIRQWASEVDRFAEGVKTFVSMGTPKQREQAIRAWAAFDGPAILVTNYHGLVKDWDAGMAKEEVPEGSAPGTVGRTSKGLLDGITANMPNLLVTFDEATAFKAPSTKTAQVCRFLSDRAKRVWGLTATLLKNNLIEGFGIYQVIRPGTFGSKSKFLSEYCDVEMQRIKGGGKIPVIRGYRNLAHFRETIEPYFYGRNKHEVATDLPTLQTKEVVCEMSREEEVKYQEALSGVFEVLGTTKDYKETKALTSLIYLQEVCDSVALVDDTFKGRSAKESGLLDLITGEFEEEKIIVYTKYERMVTRLTEILKSEGIPSVRITGKESDKERKKAQDSFQDLKSKVRVVFITDAGSEAINLQAAGALVFYDAPWSWGSYVQCLGRMIRIGSMHQNVYAVHLVAERPGKTAKQKESLDHKVLKALRRKKGLIDQILGESAQGALRFERGEDMINDVLRSLREEDE